MTASMIKPSDFKNWQDYYWTYQNILAKKYLIPMLEKNGVRLEGKKVFEIGCGSGGVIEAFAERCGKAVGLDITPFEYSEHASGKVNYITADIFDRSYDAQYADQYDLILFRDVIEHLPQKKEVFELCDRLLTKDGRIFMTYPPFYSPYGAHQQVFAKTTLGKLPYTQFLPATMYRKFVASVEKGNEQALNVAKEITSTKTTIGSLNRAIRRSVFQIDHQDCYLTRPSFEIRYGVKPRKIQWVKRVPLLREILVMGVYMILKRK